MKTDEDEEQKGGVTEMSLVRHKAFNRARMEAAAREVQRNEELESLHDSALDGRAYIRELDRQFGLGVKLSPTDKAAAVPAKRTLNLTEREWRQVL